MAKRVRRITPSFLKNIIMEEAAKLKTEAISGGELEPVEKVDAEEVDASEYADSLEKDIDHLKALKINERKLIKTIRKLRERKEVLRKRIAKRI